MSGFDDYLNAPPAQAAAPSFDAYLGAPAQVPASAAGGTGAAAVQPAAGQPAASPPGAQPGWQVPGGFVMGMGDTIKGGVQSMLHGGAWLANKVAPDSQFTKDINAAVPQVDSTIANQETAYQAQRQANQPQNLSGLITGQKPAPGIDWARLGGNVTSLAPMAMAAPEMGAMGMGGRMAVGAGLGAQNAAFQPVTDNTQPYADQKTNQLGIGALAGGVAAPITSALGSAISGVGGAAQQQLARAGVTMTPGQILGNGWARTEEKLTSVPILGDFIKNAQQRSVQSFNRATYSNALEPIGGAVPNGVAAGSGAVASVRDQIGNVYDSIAPRATFVADQNFAGDLAGIRANLAQTAPGTLDQFDNIVTNQVTDKLNPQRMMTGQQWGNTRSEINGIARNQVLGNATPDNRALADALGDLNDAINSGVGRSSPPDVLPTLQNANTAWARYKQIEGAAGSAGASNSGNVFTAAQYQNAVRKGSTLGQKAQNSGLNAQFGADAQSVLGSKYPDSGTPGRAALMGVLGALGGGGAAAAGFGAPALAIGGAAGVAALPYTGLGQRLTQALLMNRPAVAAPIGQAVQRYGVPSAAALGAALANSPNR